VSLSRFLCVVAIATLAACAKNPQPSSTTAQVGTVAGAWSGSFQPKMAQSSAVAPTNSQRTYGTATVTPMGGDITHSQVRIEINTTENATVQALAWAIYPGRCGSSAALAAPVINPSGLPRIDLRNGAGQLTTEVEITMSKASNYHINMFRETPSADASRIIACANLRPN